jgi:D-methionine transport system ATP-binding protein
MIKIKNLVKNYNGLQAVSNISLEIPSGKIYGIIGKSGAGKSTLVRLISLLENPDSGEIYFDDKRVDILQGKELLQQRHKMGMIFQNFNLFYSRNVYKNIAYPLEIINEDKNYIEKRVDELLEIVDLKDKKNTPISALSGGQKQRVAIARALANKPNILFCDEATSALDPQTTSSILNLIKEIQKTTNLSVVMITHQMEVVKESCDFVSVVDNGKIVETGNVRDIFLNPQTDITKEFISKVRFDDKVIKSIPDNLKKYSLKFSGESTKKPIISKIIRDFELDINILSASINIVNGEYIGETIAEFIGIDANIKKAMIFLRRIGINVIEIN